MGALYSPVESSELNRKTVGKLLATICKHSVDRFILWGSFLWLWEERVKGNETEVDRQSLAMALARGMSLNQSSHDTVTWNQIGRFLSRMD